MTIRRLSVLLLVAAGAGCASSTRGLANAISVAARKGHPIPLATEVDPELSLRRAYAVQRALAKRAPGDDRIAGFKAAATSATARERLAADEPVFGVLLESGRVAVGQEVALEDFRMLLVEVELGFRFRRAIVEPVADLADLRQHVSEIRMVVELPEGGFATARAPGAVDLVAANAGSAAFLVGGAIPLDARLTELEVVLDRDGLVLARGWPTDCLGDPWEALRWTVDAALREGYVIEPGQLVITGAIGGMAPARAGAYLATYGSLGELRFTVR